MDLELHGSVRMKKYISFIAQKLEKERAGLLEVIAAKDREIVSLKEELSQKELWWKERLEKEREKFAAFKEQISNIGNHKEEELKTMAEEKTSVAQQLALQKIEFESRTKEMLNQEEEIKKDMTAKLKEFARKFEEEKYNLEQELRKLYENKEDEFKKKIALEENKTKQITVDLYMKKYELEKTRSQLSCYRGMLFKDKNQHKV